MKIANIILGFIAFIIPISSYAYDFEVDGIYYNIKYDGTLSVVRDETGSSNYKGNIIIPSLVSIGENLYKVTEISSNAFRSNPNIISVVCGDSISIIQNEAFKDCNNLKAIELPSNLSKLEESTFYNCVKLIYLRLNDNSNDLLLSGKEYTNSKNYPYTFEIKSPFYDLNLKKIYLGRNVLFTEAPLVGGGDYLTKHAWSTAVTSVSYVYYYYSEIFSSSINNLIIGPLVSRLNSYYEKKEGYSKTHEEYDPRTMKINYTYTYHNSLNGVKATFNNKYLKNIVLYNPKLEIYKDPNNPVNLFSQDNYEHTNLFLSNGSSFDSEDNEWNNFINIKKIASDDKIEFISTPDSLTVPIEEPFHIDYSIFPYASNISNIKFKSTDESIITVDKEGLIYPIKEGCATVILSIGEIEAECEINVFRPIVTPEQMLVNIEEAELKIGETLQLEATILPEETSDKTIFWSSSNDNIASISEEGLVYAISAGEAIITATCGEVSAECAITVLGDAGVESLFANPDSKISIYSTDGILIKKDCSVEEVKNLSKGFYIIKSGNQSYKIAL